MPASPLSPPNPPKPANGFGAGVGAGCEPLELLLVDDAGAALDALPFDDDEASYRHDVRVTVSGSADA